MTKTDIDVLIIGAGPAGAAAAAILQREGIRPLMVERQYFPRFVIGESLLPCCMNLLEEAGLLDCLKRQGFIQKNGAVFHQDGAMCNFDFSAQFTTGWRYTWQVPRDQFDKALADEVASRGVEILYGHSVEAAEFPDSHAAITVRQPDGKQRTITAKFVLDCSGFGRVLPRLLNLEEPSHLPLRESLFAHVTGDIRPEGREEGKVWACVHPAGAWSWIIPFSNGRTSVGVVAKPEFFASYPEEPEARLRAILSTDPSAGPRLANMKVVFGPQRMSGFSRAVKHLHGSRYALVGNATEFLDPIFSSGVTLALASGNRAATVLARQLHGEPVDWQAEYSDYVMHGVNVFRAYVDAWYDGTLQEVFFSAGANPGVMRQVCSVLAGYVWDMSNPYVTQPDRALPLLSKIVKSREQALAS